MINPSEFKEGELFTILAQLRDYESNPDHLQEMIHKYFEEFDEDKNGFLDRKELRHFLTQFFKSYHLHIPLNDDFVDSAFRHIDVNHDNKIQPEELAAYSGNFIKELVVVFAAAAESHTHEEAKEAHHGDEEKKEGH